MDPTPEIFGGRPSFRMQEQIRTHLAIGLNEVVHRSGCTIFFCQVDVAAIRASTSNSFE
jgi:hypothetical protein